MCRKSQFLIGKILYDKRCRIYQKGNTFFFFFLGSVKRDIYGTQLRKAMNLVQARTEEKCEDLLRCTLQLL